MEVKFSPHGDCSKLITEQISIAQKSIYIQAYTFTNKAITLALINKKKNGIDINFIGDHNGMFGLGCTIKELFDAQIECFLDCVHAIAHNKIMIIDQSVVLTGSFNFTEAAENHNAENLLLIEDENLAKHYLDNWNAHKNHSIKYSDTHLKMTLFVDDDAELYQE